MHMPAYVVLRDDVRRSDQQTLDAQALLICAAVADNGGSYRNTCSKLNCSEVFQSVLH